MRPNPTSGPTAPTILVIDDDPALLELYTTALRRAGFEPLPTTEGPSGLEVIAQQHVDLVVCDLGLPGMSGFDVVRTLRSSAETATLPVILVTGSGGADSVIEGLEAGADDFLAKPVRLDELVARVRAHLRTHAEWARHVEDELQIRSRVVEALAGLQLSTDPEEVAEAVVREIAERSMPDFASVLQVTPDGALQELATFSPTEGVRRGARLLPARTSLQLLERAGSGPWFEDLGRRSTGRGSPSFERADLAMYASAPIYAGAELVGLVSIGLADPSRRPRPGVRARLLATVSDYSNMLTAVAGRAIAARRDMASERLLLRQVLDAGAFRIVYQPIVSLESGEAAGFEALTRFDDDARPDRRFGDAWTAGLGPDYEIAAVEQAIAGSAALPPSAFVSLNVSPRLVLEDPSRLRGVIAEKRDLVVLELTENIPIDDYPSFRAALADLGGVRIAVDDAGAGFSSLRHILELRPTFGKLDISLVRGIDGDDLRQSMAAGLQYFALRTDCLLIAEGVETVAELEALRRLGVDYAQGFLFGQPAPPDVAAKQGGWLLS